MPKQMFGKNTRPREFVFGLATLCLAPFGQAQILHATSPLPSFEVNTIKPWKPQEIASSPGATAPGRPVKIDPTSGGPRPQTSDHVHMILPIRLLIASAYNLPVSAESRIVGGPDWLDGHDNQYEISAKIDDATFAALSKMTVDQQHEQISLMEQSLLVDRFHLKVHFETREVPAYALIAAKGGPKFTPAKDDEKNSITSALKGQGIEVIVKAATMDQVVHSPLFAGATGQSGRPLADQTGLKGAYDFTLHYGPDTQSPDLGPEEPTFLTALQEQLGLRIIPSKTQVETIMIDSIERPTPD